MDSIDKKYKYKAMDSDGTVYVYENEPEYNHDSGVWDYSTGDFTKLEKLINPEESLTEININNPQSISLKSNHTRCPECRSMGEGWNLYAVMEVVNGRLSITAKCKNCCWTFGHNSFAADKLIEMVKGVY